MDLIIFDLDGVLIETKHLHFKALNDALNKKYKISWEDHLKKYDGLKTKQKLNLLTSEKDLPISDHEKIWKKKQSSLLKI